MFSECCLRAMFCLQIWFCLMSCQICFVFVYEIVAIILLLFGVILLLVVLFLFGGFVFAYFLFDRMCLCALV